MSRSKLGRSTFAQLLRNTACMVTILSYVGLVASVYMTGVVWFAQFVHYPLLDRRTDFVEFANEYQRRTMWVVTPGLTAEIVSAVGLATLFPCVMTWIGLVVLAGVWALTLRYQIPQHLQLKQHGYNEQVHRDLVRYNLPRSILWTLRSAIMVWTTTSVMFGSISQ